MKYTAFSAAAVLLVFASCATAPAPFTVNPFSLKLPAGAVSAEFDKLLTGEVERKDITVSYLPEDDAACLEYRYELVSYYLYWNRLGRETFKTALERYKFDYEQRSLNAKAGMKERRMYGTVRGYLGWQVFGFLSQLATGTTEIDMGYSFKGPLQNRTPYLTITQNAAEYKEPSESRKTTSARIKLYFTRAQAEELAALFDQEYLRSLGAAPKPPDNAADAY